MAAARAQQRGGGVTGIHIWLIAFVALWLLSTVLLVWLYTDQSAVKKTADDLRASEQSARTELRQANGARDQFAEMLTGSTDDDLPTAASKLGDLFVRIVDEDLVTDASVFEDPATGVLEAMTALYQDFRGEYENRLQAEDRASSLGEEVDQLMQERDERTEAFARTEERLTDQLRELEEDRSRYRNERDAEMDAVEERIEETKQELTRDVQAQRNENERLRQELADLKSRYESLQAKLGELQITPETLLTARQGDGQILMAKPGDEVVYIDLGRRHHLTRGMQFAVYANHEGIPADGQAKARIEVARIFDRSAECVIREVFGTEAILEGDIVNNPVYDRTRTLRFVVAGMFDLDGDGYEEQDGTDRVAALIRDWGGELVQDVSARVDFVVLGTRPPRPSGSAEDAEEQGGVEAVRQRLFNEYGRVVEQATALSIPILTQETFLHFLGYAERSGR